MAIRPRMTPKWATSSYGNDDLAWEEAKRDCRDALHEWCVRQEPHAYVDLIARVRTIPWQPGDHSSGQLGYLLSQERYSKLVYPGNLCTYCLAAHLREISRHAASSH